MWLSDGVFKEREDPAGAWCFEAQHAPSGTTNNGSFPPLHQRPASPTIAEQGPLEVWCTAEKGGGAHGVPDKRITTPTVSGEILWVYLTSCRPLRRRNPWVLSRNHGHSLDNPDQPLEIPVVIDSHRIPSGYPMEFRPSEQGYRGLP
ncbi:hypothetical protein FZEAL_6260 [Fusarium zealandicum]|uniref:Uncharacterized protein n=1 Tax=Fusarium zealandicum TaxID=1053134 RepID=A0A8H4XJN5_9HYPO|nr:hypothetical protein FZEAL_6260 [Fusarium zealandicum]